MRDVGAGAFDGALFAAGSIEGDHARVQEHSLPPRVKASPIELFALVTRPFSRGEIHVSPVPGWLIGIRAATADFFDKQPADRQRVVADHFCLNSKTRLTCIKLVVRVKLSQLRRGNRRLTIRPGSHQQANHLFNVPVAVHEFNGQPVEQFGMRWQRALPTEIVERRRETAAEIQLPESIHERSCGQRVVARNDPLREIQSVCSPFFRNVSQELGNG